MIRAVACLLAANRRSNCSLMQAMDGRIVLRSAATSKIVKSIETGLQSLM